MVILKEITGYPFHFLKKNSIIEVVLHISTSVIIYTMKLYIYLLYLQNPKLTYFLRRELFTHENSMFKIKSFKRITNCFQGYSKQNYNVYSGMYSGRYNKGNYPVNCQ